ncbi:MAG: hypothetical protein ACRCSN_04480, partial [Dermatophilaceae bacterium]
MLVSVAATAASRRMAIVDVDDRMPTADLLRQFASAAGVDHHAPVFLDGVPVTDDGQIGESR